jgi:hypothetical protein
MLKMIVVASLIFGTMLQPSLAQDLGPAVGTKAPDVGMPLDQSGQPHTVASLMGGKGFVLFFFRSVVW